MTAVLAIGLLSGCAAGHNAVTIKPYTPTDGNQAQSGTIKLRNFLVVEQMDGSAALVGTVVNSSMADTAEGDAITAITVNGQPATLSTSPLPLAADQAVIFGGDSGNATGTIAALGAKAGQLVSMTVSFEKSASIEMTVIVREAAGEFAPTTN